MGKKSIRLTVDINRVSEYAYFQVLEDCCSRTEDDVFVSNPQLSELLIFSVFYSHSSNPAPEPLPAHTKQ